MIIAVCRNTLIICLYLLVAACASKPLIPHSNEAAPLILLPASQAGIRDDRGRFREIFCAATRDHGMELPDFRSCETALVAMGQEPPGTGEPVELGATDAEFLTLIVPGLGWECMQRWLDLADSSGDHVEDLGYRIDLLDVDGLSGSANNARQIRDGLAALPGGDADRPIVLIGYSKGTPDIMEALVTYPEVSERVVAVVSIAGAVGGSPLANNASQAQANLFTRVPKSECDEGDGGAIQSLRTTERRQWLADNTLPPHIRYYSIVTSPEPNRISNAVAGAYRQLSKVDGRNDSQVLHYDQIIPDSTLLAYINADHLAAAVPIKRQHEMAGKTLFNHNDYPREVMIESILRYLEEDLARSP